MFSFEKSGWLEPQESNWYAGVWFFWEVSPFPTMGLLKWIVLFHPKDRWKELGRRLRGWLSCCLSPDFHTLPFCALYSPYVSRLGDIAPAQMLTDAHRWQQPSEATAEGGNVGVRLRSRGRVQSQGSGWMFTQAVHFPFQSKKATLSWHTLEYLLF